MDDILNWVWQGCVVAIATGTVLRVLEQSRARVRYVVWWVALVAVLMLPVVPMVGDGISTAQPVAANAVARTVPIVSIPAGRWTTSVVVALWAAWSCAFALRLAVAILALRRVKRGCCQFPPYSEMRLRCWMKVRDRGRPARLVLSEHVLSAAVLGGRTPMIALAPSIVARLSDDELDRVVVHEWAHVQRCDDVANLAQLVVHAIAGWHPGICWANRQLHVEREMACDERAVALTGSAKDYAACLAKLASLPAIRLRALPAVAALSSPGLRRRIVRILTYREVAARPVRARAAGAMACVCLTGLSLAGLRIFESSSSMVEAGDSPPRVSAAAPNDGAAAAPPSAPRPRPDDRSETMASAREARTRGPRGVRPSSTVVEAPAARDFPLPALTAGRSVVAEPVTPGDFSFSLPLAPLPSASLSSLGPTDWLAAPPSGESGSAKARPASPWRAAADVGIAAARGSEKVALSTAGFFGLFGKRVAGSFRGSLHASPSRQPQ